MHHQASSLATDDVILLRVSARVSPQQSPICIAYETKQASHSALRVFR